MVWLCSHLSEKFMNGVLWTGGNVEGLEKRVDTVTEYFRSLQLPALWRVLPTSLHQKELIPLLKAKGGLSFGVQDKRINGCHF